MKAAKCKEVDHFPIWLMRQAGRYMKVYQKLREKYTMLDLCLTPELACEVTLQPIKAFGFDAAIIFSDILMLPHALGLRVDFHDKTGIHISNPIQKMEDVNRLDIRNIEEKMHFVLKAIELTKKELEPYKTPLIGFAGSPFTVSSYLVGEGQGHDLGKFMRFLFSNFEVVHALMDKLTVATADYLSAQIKAGVDAIQIFDSWSNVLSWGYFKEITLPYLKKVIALTKNPKKVPITLFGTSNSVFYPLLQDIGTDVISFDSKVDILDMRKSVKKNIAVQGNLDPYFLLAPREILHKQALSMLESMQGQLGYIFNLGHGVMPDVPEENVKYLVDLVKSFPAQK